jgi:hypothetical protein
MLLREEDDDEEIFEVCCQFLDERVPRGWVDGRRADYYVDVDYEGQKEERKLDDEHRASREYAGWNDDDGTDYVARYRNDTDDCGRT